MKIIILQKKKIFFWNFVIILFYLAVNVNSVNACRKVAYDIGRTVVENKIVNSLYDFKVSRSMHTIVYYTEEDNQFVKMIQDCIDIYYPILCKDFDIDLARYEKIGKVNVILYSSEDSLRESLGMKKGEVPMGVYYGNTVHILSPRIWTGGKTYEEIREKFMREGPVVHELTHLVLDHKTMGNYPLWFTEGVALYYEYKHTGFEWRRDMKQQSKNICIEALHKEFHSLDERISYRRAFDLIHSLVKVQGEKKLQMLIERLSKGEAFPKAFEKEYGFSMKSLDDF